VWLWCRTSWSRRRSPSKPTVRCKECGRGIVWRRNTLQIEAVTASQQRSHQMKSVPKAHEFTPGTLPLSSGSTVTSTSFERRDVLRSLKAEHGAVHPGRELTGKKEAI
jgi:hypothetical protein